MPSSLSSASTLSFPRPSTLNGLRRSPVRNPVNLAIKAMVADGRDSLDHLQRASKMRQQQEPRRHALKRGLSSPAPVGLWDGFPTAKTVQQMMETMETVQQMMETMERIMEDPLTHNGTSFPSLSDDEPGSSYRGGRTPWEIKEGEGAYKMRFDMPGMTKNDVNVSVEENMLVIKAKKLPKEVKEGEEQEEEWPTKSYGRYKSRIVLPDNVDVEKIKAEVKDGVLYVTIPTALPSSKVLEVNVE